MLNNNKAGDFLAQQQVEKDKAKNKLLMQVVDQQSQPPQQQQLPQHLQHRILKESDPSPTPTNLAQIETSPKQQHRQRPLIAPIETSPKQSRRSLAEITGEVAAGGRSPVHKQRSLHDVLKGFSDSSAKNNNNNGQGGVSPMHSPTHRQRSITQLQGGGQQQGPLSPKNLAANPFAR